MSFRKVTHVIFDLDGTLIDSESTFDKIMNEIGEPYGKTYTKDIKMKIIGREEDDTARIAIKEMQLPLSHDEFLSIFRPKVLQELRNSPLMPGAKDLIHHLHKHNIPIAIATSAGKNQMEEKIHNHRKLFKLFHHIVCGGSDPEVKKGKPAPDIFLICASRFPEKPKPEQVLVFEDSPYGVKGAIRAGMQVVMVPDPVIPQHLQQSATIVLKSLKDFKPELFGLPEFNKNSI